MLFYVVLGGLFSVYALDLLVLVVVAMLARARAKQAPPPEQMREGPVYLAESARWVAGGGGVVRVVVVVEG